MEPKFPSKETYINWLEEMVFSIYYSNISMNNERIIEIIQEISRTLHLSEGQHYV